MSYGRNPVFKVITTGSDSGLIQFSAKDYSVNYLTPKGAPATGYFKFSGSSQVFALGRPSMYFSTSPAGMSYAGRVPLLADSSPSNQANFARTYTTSLGRVVLRGSSNSLSYISDSSSPPVVWSRLTFGTIPQADAVDADIRAFEESTGDRAGFIVRRDSSSGSFSRYIQQTGIGTSYDVKPRTWAGDIPSQDINLVHGDVKRFPNAWIICTGSQVEVSTNNGTSFTTRLSLTSTANLKYFFTGIYFLNSRYFVSCFRRDTSTSQEAWALYTSTDASTWALAVDFNVVPFFVSGVPSPWRSPVFRTSSHWWWSRPGNSVLYSSNGTSWTALTTSTSADKEVFEHAGRVLISTLSGNLMPVSFPSNSIPASITFDQSFSYTGVDAPSGESPTQVDATHVYCKGYCSADGINWTRIPLAGDSSRALNSNTRRAEQAGFVSTAGLLFRDQSRSTSFTSAVTGVVGSFFNYRGRAYRLSATVNDVANLYRADGQQFQLVRGYSRPSPPGITDWFGARSGIFVAPDGIIIPQTGATASYYIQGDIESNLNEVIRIDKHIVSDGRMFYSIPINLDSEIQASTDLSSWTTIGSIDRSSSPWGSLAGSNIYATQALQVNGNLILAVVFSSSASGETRYIVQLYRISNGQIIWSRGNFFINPQVQNSGPFTVHLAASGSFCVVATSNGAVAGIDLSVPNPLLTSTAIFNDSINGGKIHGLTGIVLDPYNN